MRIILSNLQIFSAKKIVNDEIIFVPSEGTKAQHTLAYVSILESDTLVQKELIRTLPAKKIVNDEIIFVPSERTKAQHSKPM